MSFVAGSSSAMPLSDEANVRGFECLLELACWSRRYALMDVLYHEMRGEGLNVRCDSELSRRLNIACTCRKLSRATTFRDWLEALRGVLDALEAFGHDSSREPRLVRETMRLRELCGIVAVKEAQNGTELDGLLQQAFLCERPENAVYAARLEKGRADLTRALEDRSKDQRLGALVACVLEEDWEPVRREMNVVSQLISTLLSHLESTLSAPALVATFETLVESPVAADVLRDKQQPLPQFHDDEVEEEEEENTNLISSSSSKWQDTEAVARAALKSKREEEDEARAEKKKQKKKKKRSRERRRRYDDSPRRRRHRRDDDRERRVLYDGEDNGRRRALDDDASRDHFDNSRRAAVVEKRRDDKKVGLFLDSDDEDPLPPRPPPQAREEVAVSFDRDKEMSSKGDERKPVSDDDDDEPAAPLNAANKRVAEDAGSSTPTKRRKSPAGKEDDSLLDGSPPSSMHPALANRGQDRDLIIGKQGKPTRVRRRWSEDEEKELVDMIRTYGNQWALILRSSTSLRGNGRTAVDLKDKARNLLKKKPDLFTPKKKKDEDSDDDDDDDTVDLEAFSSSVNEWAKEAIVEDRGSKIHLSVVRTAYSRSKPQAGPILSEMKNPKSSVSQMFRKIILSIVGEDNYSKSCVISGVNQIGLLNYRLRAESDDYPPTRVKAEDEGEAVPEEGRN